ncbi:MAG: hypothetical protein AAF515_12600 [Pseudomonadota bacterium]
MKHLRASVLALIGLTLSGCASLTPAEICSAQWIKPRADAAIDGFKTNADGALNALRRASEDIATDGKLGLARRAVVLVSLTRLVGQFRDGQALRDLRTLGQTCNDPDLALRAFTDVLGEYGAPQSAIDLLNEVETFRELLREQRALGATSG